MDIETDGEGGQRSVEEALPLDAFAREAGGGILFGTFELAPDAGAAALLDRARARPSRAWWSAATDGELAASRLVASLTHDRGVLVGFEDGTMAVLDRLGRSLRAPATMAGAWRLASSDELRGLRAAGEPLPRTLDASVDRGVARYVEVALVDEARADALLPVLLWSHDVGLAMLEARDRFVAAGRGDLARDAEKLGARRGERWKSLLTPPPVADPGNDPVAALVAAGLGRPGPSTLGAWPGNPWHVAIASAELIAESRSRWRETAPEMEVSIVAQVAALLAEDVHAAVAALVTPSPTASASELGASPSVWVAALLRPTRPSPTIAALGAARDPALVPVLDTLLLLRTPRFAGSNEEVRLIETRAALAPYDVAFAADLAERFIAALENQDEVLEMAHALVLIERLSPTTFGRISAKAMRWLADDAYVTDHALLGALERTRNGPALALLARTGAFDLGTRAEAARRAVGLGVREATDLAADLERRWNRALRRDGM